MRLPKQVIIAGRTTPVVSDKTMRGGEWFNNPSLIKIGHHEDEEERLNIFIHECLEAILTLRGHRYEGYPESYRFVMDHAEFQNVINDLYLAIKDIIDPRIFSGKKE